MFQINSIGVCKQRTCLFMWAHVGEGPSCHRGGLQKKFVNLCFRDCHDMPFQKLLLRSISCFDFTYLVCWLFQFMSLSAFPTSMIDTWPHTYFTLCAIFPASLVYLVCAPGQFVCSALQSYHHAVV